MGDVGVCLVDELRTDRTGLHSLSPAIQSRLAQAGAGRGETEPHIPSWHAMSCVTLDSHTH